MPKGVLERISWDAPDEKALVELRRLLVSYIKSGMLERKDQELEIAVVAMMVWFQRQDRERMFSILESWGT